MSLQVFRLTPEQTQMETGPAIFKIMMVSVLPKDPFFQRIWRSKQSPLCLRVSPFMDEVITNKSYLPLRKLLRIYIMRIHFLKSSRTYIILKACIYDIIMGNSCSFLERRCITLTTVVEFYLVWLQTGKTSVTRQVRLV